MVWNIEEGKEQQMLLLYKEAGVHTTHVLHSTMQDTHFQQASIKSSYSAITLKDPFFNEIKSTFPEHEWVKKSPTYSLF